VIAFATLVLFHFILSFSTYPSLIKQFVCMVFCLFVLSLLAFIFTSLFSIPMGMEGDVSKQLCDA